MGLAPGGLSLFLPLIRAELGLTFAEAGSLVAAASVTYALMQIPTGYLADRFGPKRVFLVGFLGASLCVVVFAQLSALSLLIVIQAVAGVFRALTFAPGMLLMSALFSRDRLSTALGMITIGGFGSMLVLNTLGPALVQPLGWRTLFVAFGLSGVMMWVAYWRWGHPGPPGRRSDRSPLAEMTHLFRFRLMWMMGVVHFVRLAATMGVVTWLPSLIVLEKGFSLQEAGVVAIAAAAFTAPSNLLGGYVNDRLRNPYLVIGGSIGALAACTVLLVRAEGLLAIIVWACASEVCRQVGFGPMFALPIQLLGPATAGRSTGFGNFFANAGAFTFAYLIGALKDLSGSFALGFDTVAALCVVGVAFTVLLARMKPAVRGAAEAATAAR